MLDDYKKAYDKCADIIPNWRIMNKNDLVNKYIDIEQDPRLANAYMSAIIVRYWGALSKYKLLSYKSISEQEIYHDWLVQAILRAIKHRKWKDPNNKLYNDPNGPDKVINRCIISERLIWFQGANTHKRKQNFNMESIEHIEEDTENNTPIPTYESEEMSAGNMDVSNLITNAFDNKEYVMAFMVDGIVNSNVFDSLKDENGKPCIKFNEKKLLRHMNTLKPEYSKIFAQMFNKPIKTVEEAILDCNKLSNNRMKTAIKKNMKKLQKIYSIEMG